MHWQRSKNCRKGADIWGANDAHWRIFGWHSSLVVPQRSKWILFDRQLRHGASEVGPIAKRSNLQYPGRSHCEALRHRCSCDQTPGKTYDIKLIYGADRKSWYDVNPTTPSPIKIQKSQRRQKWNLCQPRKQIAILLKNCDADRTRGAWNPSVARPPVVYQKIVMQSMKTTTLNDRCTRRNHRKDNTTSIQSRIRMMR